jgi:hypothetical protein
MKVVVIRSLIVIGLAIQAVLFVGSAASESSLPNCIESYPANSGWHKKPCFAEFTFDNGVHYVGEWKPGRYWNLPHGQGEMNYPNGDQYIGEFELGRMSGKGKMNYANGGYYEGEWKDGEWHGEGSQFDGKTSKLIIGTWKYGKLVSENEEARLAEEKRGAEEAARLELERQRADLERQKQEYEAQLKKEKEDLERERLAIEQQKANRSEEKSIGDEKEAEEASRLEFEQQQAELERRKQEQQAQLEKQKQELERLEKERFAIEQAKAAEEERRAEERRKAGEYERKKKEYEEARKVRREALEKRRDELREKRKLIDDELQDINGQIKELSGLVDPGERSLVVDRGSEQRAKLEEEKSKAEQARTEEEKSKAEQARTEEEKPKAEQARTEEEKSKAEQARTEEEYEKTVVKEEDQLKLEELQGKWGAGTTFYLIDKKEEKKIYSCVSVFNALSALSKGTFLKKCQGGDETFWQNCQGNLMGFGGRKYLGVFKDGLFYGAPDFSSDTTPVVANARDGYGTPVVDLESPQPIDSFGIYIGQYKNARFHGQGTFFPRYETGSACHSWFDAEFKDGEPHGRFERITIFFSGREWEVKNGRKVSAKLEANYHEKKEIYKVVGEFRDGEAHLSSTVEYIASHADNNGFDEKTFYKYVGEFNRFPEEKIADQLETKISLSQSEFGKSGDRRLEGYVLYGQGELVVHSNRSLGGLREAKGYGVPEEGLETYVGEFKDNSFHGQGTYTYADGDEYSGKWSRGKKHGRGTLTFADGSGKIVGEWKDGSPFGSATFIFPLGDEVEGYWNYNEFVAK